MNVIINTNQRTAFIQNLFIYY